MNKILIMFVFMAGFIIGTSSAEYRTDKQLANILISVGNYVKFSNEQQNRANENEKIYREAIFQFAIDKRKE